MNDKAKKIKGQDQAELFIEKVVAVRRVSKVTKGGRTFSFSVLIVVGDGNGRVGVGSGSGAEVMDAKKKATESAKKNMARVPLREGRTLHHDVSGRFGAGKVSLRSAPSGTGIIAGGALRAIFECLGVQDVVAKSIGTANPHNMVKACLRAFEDLASLHSVAKKRNKKIKDIVGGGDSSSKKDN